MQEEDSDRRSLGGGGGTKVPFGHPAAADSTQWCVVVLAI